MGKTERVREVLTSPPSAEYWQEKNREGWRLVAVEWERGVEEGTEGGALKEEVPYGLKVSDDSLYLIEESDEVAAMTLMLDQIVADKSLSIVAEELNRRGFRRRGGSKWTQSSVFNMLPRLIEVAPRIYSSDEWYDKQQRLRKMIG